MKNFLLIFLSVSLFQNSYSQNVGVGTTTPKSAAILDVTSTTKGFLPPRMNTTQRDAIIDPQPGLMIYNLTTENIEFYTPHGWSQLKKINQPINTLFGGSANEVGYFIQQTTDGGYIVSASTSSSANGDIIVTNHGIPDCWILKLDASGNIMWNKLLGGIQTEIPYSIQQTTDGGYIFASYCNSSLDGDVTDTTHGGSDWWIVKLDPSGNITWNTLLGGSGLEDNCCIRQTAEGGYIVTGNSMSSATGNVTGTNHGPANTNDVWIVKLTATGNISWNKLIGGNDHDYAYSITQTAESGYILAGYSNSSANGDVTATNHGSSDCWVVKLDASGNITWNKLLGGNGGEDFRSIQQTADAGYIVAGYSSSSANGDITATNHGNGDYWIVKLDPSGNISWNKLLGGAGFEFAYCIQQTEDGGYVVGGVTATSPINGDVIGTYHGTGTNDAWVLKLNPSGNIVWSKLLGGSGNDNTAAIQ